MLKSRKLSFVGILLFVKIILQHLCVEGTDKDQDVKCPHQATAMPNDKKRSNQGNLRCTRIQCTLFHAWIKVKGFSAFYSFFNLILEVLKNNVNIQAKTSFITFLFCGKHSVAEDSELLPITWSKFLGFLPPSPSTAILTAGCWGLQLQNQAPFTGTCLGAFILYACTVFAPITLFTTQQAVKTAHGIMLSCLDVKYYSLEFLSDKNNG